MEDIRKCKKRGMRGLSWTSAKKALSKTVAPGGGAPGGGRCDGLRLRGVWRNSGGGFRPVEAAGGEKTVACAYFRGRGACSQYDPKVRVGARSLDPKGDAYYGS